MIKIKDKIDALSLTIGVKTKVSRYGIFETRDNQ
jgi:hypothetical protein